MPVQTSYPGVYVQELSSGVHTIVGVSTSIAAFIGRASQGPVNKPVQCTSYSDFVRVFTEDSSFSDLARQVRMFFMNGGQECYVLRIVNNASAVNANATLANSGGTAVLIIDAISPGVSGNSIQCVVDYNTQYPESTFNLNVYYYSTNASGQQVVASSENWTALTMNPSSPRYAVKYINQNSNLVQLRLPGAAIAPTNGYSVSGRPLPVDTVANLGAVLNPILPTNSNILMSVNGGAPVNINLVNILAGPPPTMAAVVANIQAAINAAFPGLAPAVSVDFSTLALPGTTDAYLSFGLPGGDIKIYPSPSNDLSATLMLGTNQGGVEKSAYADIRPAPNGVVFNLGAALAPGLATTFDNLVDFAAQTAATLNSLTVNGLPSPAIVPALLPAGLMFQSLPPVSVNGNNDGVRQKWATIASLITSQNASNPAFKWTGKVWGSRLAITPANGSANTLGAVAVPAPFNTYFTQNISYYNLGLGAQGLQTAGTPGVDGSAPVLSDYVAAFSTLDTFVDIFNIMILARDNSTTSATDLNTVWGTASSFCQKRRAFLLVDPPDTPDTSLTIWKDVQSATDPSTGVNLVRQGLVIDYSAIYFPRITISENGAAYNMGPSGTMAGVMARTDASRGVWKAPAGTEANLLGISGLEYKFTDGQNGVLNPAAINTLRIFPDGIVSWGARTLAGDDSFASEWKYIPVRRTALFIEESLYRGLKWVVFEPNDEPLWSQIRLNVGSFMHRLFVQGAFQGQTKDKAYFVSCDSSTTTQNDIDLGIVNVIVGFAPLKPAEFVILSIQQMAGQIQI